MPTFNYYFRLQQILTSAKICVLHVLLHNFEYFAWPLWSSKYVRYNIYLKANYIFHNLLIILKHVCQHCQYMLLSAKCSPGTCKQVVIKIVGDTCLVFKVQRTHSIWLVKVFSLREHLEKIVAIWRHLPRNNHFYLLGHMILYAV